jgi:hypothetical protein
MVSFTQEEEKEDEESLCSGHAGRILGIFGTWRQSGSRTYKIWVPS